MSLVVGFDVLVIVIGVIAAGFGFDDEVLSPLVVIACRMSIVLATRRRLFASKVPSNTAGSNMTLFFVLEACSDCLTWIALFVSS